jgi:AcrR family transcriptional regulator
MPGQKIPEQERREQILNAAMQVALRDGIGAVTVRAVAVQAGLSHALILFHFKRKETLLRALLASLLSTVLAAPVAPSSSRRPALDRLRALVRDEMTRLRAEPARVRLLLDSWALGARHPALREQVTRAWQAYRGAFRPVIEQTLSEHGRLARGASVDGVAAFAVAIVNQCMVQELIDPEGFPRADYASTADAAVGMLLGAAG